MKKPNPVREDKIAISQLRQWLNEDRITDPKKMVTNEELEHWLKGIREDIGEWEEEWDKKWGWYLKAGNVKAKSFINNLLKEKDIEWEAQLTILLEQFINSYCEHGKKNRDNCEECGRFKLKEE